MKRSEPVPNRAVDYLAQHYERNLGDVKTITEGVQRIERLNRISELLEKLHLPIQPILDQERKTFQYMVETFDWKPKLSVTVHGKKVELLFPFNLNQAVTQTGNIAIMRNSPAHRNLGNGIDDTHALDLLCPVGVEVTTLSRGFCHTQLTQLDMRVAGNDESLADSDNRIYVLSKVGSLDIFWCVRHIAPKSEEEVQSIQEKIKADGGSIAEGFLIGKTGMSGYYADNPPLCHLHVVVYTIEKSREGSNTLRSWPIKLS